MHSKKGCQIDIAVLDIPKDFDMVPLYGDLLSKPNNYGKD